jgi:hypothetical protein
MGCTGKGHTHTHNGVGSKAKMQRPICDLIMGLWD